MINTVGQLIELLENVPADTRIVFTEDSLFDENSYLMSPIDIVYETSLFNEEDEGTLTIKVKLTEEEEEEEMSNAFLEMSNIDEYAIAFNQHLIDMENV